MSHGFKLARDSAAGQRHALHVSLGYRVFAGLLALLLCCTLLPIGALASSDEISASSMPDGTPIPTKQNDPANAQPDGADAPEAIAPEPQGSDKDLPSGEAADSATETDEPEDSAADPSAHDAGSFDQHHYITISESNAGASSSDGADTLRPGALAHASVYKVESDDGIASLPVPDDGTFSYTWYASTSRTPWGLSGADVLAGHSSTITITDDMVGKYLFVKATASDGTSVSGPSFLNWPNGVLRGAGPVAAAEKPPVIDPEDPVDPEEPPVDPVDPVDPDDPDDPNDPIGPIDPVKPADPTKPEKPGDEVASCTATVTITGTTRHRPGSSFFYANWVPATEYHWAPGAYFTAWTAIAQALTDHGYSYTAGIGFPSSVTTPDGSYTLQTTGNEPRSYWALFANGAEVPVPAYEYVLRDGDDIELRYIDGESVLGEAPLVTYPQEETPDKPVIWGGSGGNGTGAATSLVTPTTDLSCGWTLDLSDGQQDAGWSEPLIIDDRLYLATATQFRIVDRATGKVIESTPLAGALDQGGCQPLYASGKIVVPLANGQLQAFSVTTMHCIWVSEALPATTAQRAMAIMAAAVPDDAPQQSTSSLYAHDGRLYAATTIANEQGTRRSWLSCLDIATGQLQWAREGAESGFYWPGTAQLNGYILVGNADGGLEAIPASSTTGEAVGTLQLGAAANGAGAGVVTEGEHAYCVTRDGVFHKVRVNSDGALETAGSVAFAASSASTPTLCDGKAYVGGASADGTGVLACIDTATLACHVVNATDSAQLPAEVSGMPLVSQQPTGTYVYFTCSGPASGVYLYKTGDAAARTIYEPAPGASNARISSITTGPDGRLYCVTAAGQLIELKEQPAAIVPDPGNGSDDPGFTPVPDESAPSPATPAPTTNGAPTDATENLMRAVDRRSDLELLLSSVSLRQAGPAPAPSSLASTAPIPTEPAPADDVRIVSTRQPISSFIEDISMQAQNVSLLKWVLVAGGGLLVGALVLLVIGLPVRSLLRNKR